jgi:hypothetical protein
VNEALPEFALGIGDRGSGIRQFPIQQQTLHDTTTGNPVTQKSRGKDTRIVENEEIARRKIAVEVAEHHVFDRAGAAKDQESRSATFG